MELLGSAWGAHLVMDADRDPHQHVLRPLNHPPIDAQQVRSLQGLHTQRRVSAWLLCLCFCSVPLHSDLTSSMQAWTAARKCLTSTEAAARHETLNKILHG